MKAFSKLINIPLAKVLVFVFIIIILILAYYYYYGNSETKTQGIVGGLLAGAIVALCQFLLSWYEFKTIEKFKTMQIINVLSNRDDREFYQKLIEKSNKNISVMGVTADRFIEHFADISSDQARAKVLLKAMKDRKVKVRLLLPKKEHLWNEKLVAKYETTKSHLEIIKINYPNFKFRYFNHLPQHSIFIVDDECLLGPVFPDVSSKDTPAIYLKNESPYAQRYLEYFKKEWINCK